MAKASEVIDVEQLDEPITEVPEAPSTKAHESRDERMQSALDEAGDSADFESTIESLVDKEEITADDIRRVGGKDAEGLTDEELLAAYKKAEAGEAASTDSTDEAEGTDTKQLELPFPVYDAEGNKVDASKLTLEDLLSGKVQIGYNAMGKEQRKALNDILRVAANGHLNESKIATSLAERNQVHQQLTELRKEHEAWAKDRKIWQGVLNAAAAGNIEPLKKVLASWVAETSSVAPETAQGGEDASLVAAGQQYVIQTIIPAAYSLADAFGADRQEVTNEILRRINQEPAEFLTEDKIATIINYEVPAELERLGYANKGGTPAQTSDPRDEKIAALEKQMLELKAGKENEKTAAARAKMKKAPASGGGSTPGAGDSMPAMKSREEMKKWLRGETS